MLAFFFRLIAVCLLLQFIDISSSAGLGRADDNSAVTYVQIKPLIHRNVQSARSPGAPRTSRIENVPLQIKQTAIHPHSTSKTPEAIKTPVQEVGRSQEEKKIDIGEVVRSQEEGKINLQEVENRPEEVKIPVQEVVRTPRSGENTSAKGKELPIEATDDYADQNNESEVRFDTSEAVTPETTEQNEASTQISTPQENDLARPEVYYPKGESSPYILNKYGKPKHHSKKYYGSSEQLEPTYRKYLETRQYRSSCRCAKLSNCPKLQISVPRCPQDYYMCCF